jgi:hypothetical protein
MSLVICGERLIVVSGNANGAIKRFKWLFDNNLPSSSSAHLRASSAGEESDLGCSRVYGAEQMGGHPSRITQCGRKRAEPAA